MKNRLLIRENDDLTIVILLYHTVYVKKTVTILKIVLTMLDILPATLYLLSTFLLHENLILDLV